jgi:hypothetical protein
VEQDQWHKDFETDSVGLFPRTAEDIEKLIRKLAKDNSWGYKKSWPTRHIRVDFYQRRNAAGLYLAFNVQA